MRKRYYIVFVAREEDGRLRKIPVPLHYAYIFVAAAVVGAFTITGMAGSYTPHAVKDRELQPGSLATRSSPERITSSSNRWPKQKEVQAASLGSLASEVTALYGLKQNKLAKGAATANAVPVAVDTNDYFTDAAYTESFNQLSSLRSTALSGQLSRAFEMRLSPSSGDGWLNMADAPSLWPVVGPITSSFGEREDPFNGEGAFHAGIDISTSFGQAVRATGDGVVLTAGLESGYGREIVVDHGHGIQTLYGHLSGFAVTSGQQVQRGQVIGYVGTSGRTTGPHLHYEVRIRNTPVNPHKYLRETMDQLAAASAVAANPTRN